MSCNALRSYDGEVTLSGPITSESSANALHCLRIRLPADSSFSVGPGQFVLLAPAMASSVQPRPFSVYWAEGRSFSIIIQPVGPNTRAYTSLRPGDRITVMGPQGSANEIDDEIDRYILIGGGVGIAALASLAYALRQVNKSVVTLLGAKRSADIFGTGLFCQAGSVHKITEDNPTSAEQRQGLVTELLEEHLINDGGSSQVVACGPLPMLHMVAGLCHAYNNPCQVILETVMACGMGSCKGCAIFGGPTGQEVKHICSDGPAFDANWVDWPKLMTEHHNRPKLSLRAMPKAGLNITLTGQADNVLELERPLINASGCLSAEALLQNRVDITELGALETKGVTVDSRCGNQMPRVCETPSGMMNAIGLEGVGLDQFLAEELPIWLSFGKPVWVNISGFSQGEYWKLARAIGQTEVAALVVNISCPNVHGGGLAFGVNQKRAAAVVAGVRQAAPNKFIIVKLTPAPGTDQVVRVARAVKKAGADAIMLINTMPALAIDIRTLRPKLANVYGGLSGPAIRPIAVQMVRKVYEAKLGIPIIGLGGIDSGEAAAEFMIAGASAVEIGTASFANRSIFTKVAGRLCQIAGSHDFDPISQMIGSLKLG